MIGLVRRQADFDALRVAAGVIFTVAGVIKESSEYRNESLLLGEIAAEIQNIGRRLGGADQREEEGTQNAIPGQVRHLTDEAAQWERHLQDEEEEANQAAMTLENCTPEGEAQRSSSSSGDSHRRRRMLAQHHKDHIGENRTGEDEDHSLMAMSRSSTEAGELGDRAGREEEEVEPLDDDPLPGRFLPALPGEVEHFLNLVQLERRRGEALRALLKYLDWLRGDPQWRALQGPLIEELQAASLSASMQVVMLTQALCSCRGAPTPGNDIRGEVDRPLFATQAVRRAASLVNELREHCDDCGRLMQQR